MSQVPDDLRARVAAIRAITQRLADLLGEHLERAPGQWCIFRALAWEDAPAGRAAAPPALAAVPGSR